MDLKTDRPGITFAVHDVEPATKPLGTEPTHLKSPSSRAATTPANVSGALLTTRFSGRFTQRSTSTGRWRFRPT